MEELYQNKIKGLKDLIHMVIHDLRNPTLLIDNALDQLAQRCGINPFE